MGFSLIKKTIDSATKNGVTVTVVPDDRGNGKYYVAVSYDTEDAYGRKGGVVWEDYGDEKAVVSHVNKTLAQKARADWVKRQPEKQPKPWEIKG